MKKFKLDQDNVTDSVVSLVSLGAGMLLGGAIVGVLPTEHQEIGKAAGAGVGLLASSGFAKDKSTMGTVIKNVSMGIALRNGYDVATGMLKSTATVKDTPSIADRAYYGAIGLACPCEENPWGMRAAEVRRISEFPTQIQEVTDNQRALDTSNVANAIV